MPHYLPPNITYAKAYNLLSEWISSCSMQSFHTHTHTHTHTHKLPHTYTCAHTHTQKHLQIHTHTAPTDRQSSPQWPICFPHPSIYTMPHHTPVTTPPPPPLKTHTHARTLPGNTVTQPITSTPHYTSRHHTPPFSYAFQAQRLAQ